MVTRDGGVPLVSHAYPSNRPDVTQFATMIDQLIARHAALGGEGGVAGEVTVVFDAGQSSVANFAHLAATGLGFVGSVPPSDCPDLLAVPATNRHLLDETRFGGLSALETRREVYGFQRRVVLTHSPTLHQAQSRGFDQTLASASARLAELAWRASHIPDKGPYKVPSGTKGDKCQNGAESTHLNSKTKRRRW